MDTGDNLEKAKRGNINSFNELFNEYQVKLKSYLYRLLTNREDVEDFYHNTFIQAFDKISTFKGELYQFKGWVFTIATNLALNHLKNKMRWETNAQDECRDSLMNDSAAQQNFVGKVIQSTYNTYEIDEHIDFCFTCINKTLSIEQQVALLLKDVYSFKAKEIAEIMNKSLGQVKHYLLDARKEMTDIFNGRCALINKKGTCHQCSELQGLFNPKLNFHREIMKIKMVKEAKKNNKKELFNLRENIIAEINPMENKGSDLHDHFMQHLKKINNLN